MKLGEQIVKVLMVQHPHSFQQHDFPPLVMALGFFDGVHLGHRKVIETAKATAVKKSWKSAVMTFDPHPSVVLSQENRPVEYITPLREKIDLISEQGIDYLFIIRFTSSFANLDPAQFVQQYLIDVNVRHVVAGFDFTYGKYGKGTMDTLPNHGMGMLEVTTVAKMEESNEKISSTSIRQRLREGETASVASFLGRYYETKGTVIHGEKRGRQLGFPTANIRLNDDYIIPKPGVYAVRLLVNGRWEKGVCNIGYKPTFHAPGQSQLSIEVHLLNFKRSIYGEEVIVEWRRRIRDEKKFHSLDDLKAQIANDIAKASNFLNE